MEQKTPTTQEEVFKALIAQGGPSSVVAEVDGSCELACMYRGPYGRRCAAGLLITDENYDVSLEGRTASSERVQAALERSGGLANFTYPEIVMMQQAHDKAARLMHPTDSWEMMLAQQWLQRNLRLPKGA